jgi:hypothetical protein
MEYTRSELLRLIETNSQPSLQAAAWFFLAFHTADVLQAIDKLAQAVAVARIANASPALGAEFSARADTDFALASVLGEYAAHLIEPWELCVLLWATRPLQTLLSAAGA